MNGTLTEPPLTFVRPVGMDETPDAVAPEAESDMLPAVIESVDDSVPATIEDPVTVPAVVESERDVVELTFTSNRRITELHIKFD